MVYHRRYTINQPSSRGPSSSSLMLPQHVSFCVENNGQKPPIIDPGCPFWRGKIKGQTISAVTFRNDGQDFNIQRLSGLLGIILVINSLLQEMVNLITELLDSPPGSHPIPGVMIAVECKDHAGKRLFYIEGPTDDNGLSIIFVNSEHRHEHCEAYTIRNPTSCNIPSDSNRSPVSLTHNNDIDSNERKIGPFSFRSTKSHPACKAMMAEYTVDHKAGPASVVSVHTNGAKQLLSQVEEEEHIERDQTFQSRTRDCCGDDYCHPCNSAVEEEAAAGVDHP